MIFGSILFSIVMFIGFVVCVAVSIWIKISDNKFVRSHIETTGTIIGYHEGEDSSLKIAFYVDGKEEIERVGVTSINRNKYPIGKQIRIAYTRFKILGIPGYEIRIIRDDGTIPTQKIVFTFFIVLALGLLIASLVFLKKGI